MSKQIYYETRSWSWEPKEVEIDKETESFIWIQGRQTAKKSDSTRYFKTKVEVREYHVTRLQTQKGYLLSQLEDIEKELQRAKELPV